MFARPAACPSSCYTHIRLEYRTITLSFAMQELMEDPVVCADGYAYERVALEAWLAGHDTSPMTGAPLPHKHMVPCQIVRELVHEWLAVGDAGS